MCRRRVEFATISYAEGPPLAFRNSWKRRRAAAAAEEEDELGRSPLPPVNPSASSAAASSPEAEVSDSAKGIEKERSPRDLHT